ncbi:SDR family oxidoreductase [Georgfuchsia toluolica]|uniref:SDR family oxidoreductase n=1 Tax=Georgfuchsia toluolica TaxID=424218 RepID=A0A916J2A5_9PROT|nr:SDR family oxidoreductase [Georgfuchsia toluolica]CAG4882672.1 SDR family oxidoreductase [Georgfuchsia toluolica]
MRGINLVGMRVLITQSQEFMGPALCDCFRDFGAEVIADSSLLTEQGQPQQLIASAGRIDALVLNLSTPAPSTPVEQVGEDEWQGVFNTMVNPMQQMVKAVLPQMLERKSGKILLMGSASALKGMPNRSSYAAARGAQLSYIQAVGVEVARYGIQINAIAQNFVENPTYFPLEVQLLPAFKERLKWQVPLGRLVTPYEDAAFAAYLCSDAANCFVGQVFPMSGGWVTR